MADTEQKLEALEAKVVDEANSPNPQADAPKKNAVAAEPSHIAKMSEYEDLGKAVVKPTDSNPDATKKMTKVSGQAPQKHQGAADPMPKLSGHNTKLENKETKDKDGKEIKEGDLPPALKKAIDAKKDDKEKKEVKESEEKKDEKAKKADDAEVRTEDEDKEKKKEIDVKEHVDALIAGEKDLTEEFKAKAATIFEAAIKSKVAEMSESIKAQYEETLVEEVKEIKAELQERLDAYLEYVADEWVSENELAIEHGLKTEMTESFLEGMKKLFEDHYVTIPEEKYDVIESMVDKLDEMEGKLNEQIEKNIALNRRLAESTSDVVFGEVAEGLAASQKEKLATLVENVEFESETDYREKLVTLKESYFPSNAGSQRDKSENLSEGNENPGNIQEISSSMEAYLQTLNRVSKK